MATQSKPSHLEILTTRQRKLLDWMGPILKRHGFYLAGGTALALFLGHRKSVNLDWFTPKRMRDTLAFASMLQDEGVPLRIEQLDRGTIYGSVHTVRVSLLEYRYPLVRSLVSRQSGFACASMDDLGCMKLSAVAQRGTKKNFIDIFALLRTHTTLTRMIRLYQKKYTIRDINHVLKSLVYFDEADAERMPRMVWDTRWAEVKMLLNAEVLRFVRTMEP